MRKYLFFILIIFVLQITETKSEFCVKGSYPPRNRPTIKRHVLNLDLPPKIRWRELGVLQKQEIHKILDAFKSLILRISPRAQFLIDYVDKNFGSLLDLMPHPYGDELRGLAEAAEMNSGELLLYNIFYEFFTVCTSVIARDDRGHIYHARNLDFGIFMGWDTKNDDWLMTELLRNATVNLEWQRAGKTLFRSTNFAGYIGVLTGVRPAAFAFSINERFVPDGGFLGILKWLMGYRQSTWLTFLSRDLMEKSTSYEEAKKLLTESELVAPAYFILSSPSPHKACVITRSRREVLDVWEIGTPVYNNTSGVKSNFLSLESVESLNSESNEENSAAELEDSKLRFRPRKKDSILRKLLNSRKPSKSNETDANFFVLETNYDRWSPPPFYDDRRTTALHCIRELSAKKVNFEGLFDLLSNKPLLNKLTVYTALMEPATGKLESYIQYCPDPCDPW